MVAKDTLKTRLFYSSMTYNNRKFLFITGYDAAMAALSFLLSLYLRVGQQVYDYPLSFLVTGCALFTLSAIFSFYYFKTPNGMWRYFSLNGVIQILKASILSILIFLPCLFIFNRLEIYPRSAIFINAATLFILLTVPRVLLRLFYDKSISFMRHPSHRQKTSVILVGIDNVSETFIREIGRNRFIQYDILGIIDTKAKNQGRVLHGISVVGTLNSLESFIEKSIKKGRKPQRLLVTPHECQGETLIKLLSVCEHYNIPISRLPKLTEFQNHAQDVTPISSLPIEDLLCRSQRQIDKTLNQTLIAGKNILVTGAGGSIGSELVRQICDLKPNKLILLDNSEFLLYEIDSYCRAKHADLDIQTFLADIRDQRSIQDIFTQVHIDLVFHVAALKHVPILETNKIEGIKTNIFGTKNVVDASLKHKVKKFVLISTDKAVEPSSFMGLTKRVAELYCQNLNGFSTEFVTVRFGNVLGSSGSVVPLFKKQISNGGPITITHPDVTRYFMTIKEAVGLIIQAAAFPVSNHDPRIYLLDMGEPIRIVDLAKQMIRLAGLKPDKDIDIKFIGLRPGEKLHEELYYDSEKLGKTQNQDILLVQPEKKDAEDVLEKISELKHYIEKHDYESCDRLLQSFISTLKLNKNAA